MLCQSPLGTIPLSTRLSEVDFQTAEDEFQKFIEDPRNDRVYIVKLNLYNPVLQEEVPIYISSHDYNIYEYVYTPMSRTGGLILWNNDMNMQERFRSVYRGGIRRNRRRY